MRHLNRIGAAIAALAALLLLVAGTALAGNFGEVTILEDGSGPPTAGDERDIRFALLQHGVTPIEDGRVDVTLTHPETGDELIVQAVHEGNGIWTASVTFPAAGDWRVHVAHEWFDTSAPTSLSVSPGGTAPLPAALVVGGFAAALLVVLGAILVIARRPATVLAASRGAARAEG